MYVKKTTMKRFLISLTAILTAIGALILINCIVDNKLDPILDANIEALTSGEGHYVLPCIEVPGQVCEVQIGYADGSLHYFNINNAQRI